MCTPPEIEVIINGVKFIDVTNETVAGKTYNYEEAVAYTKGEIIATSGGRGKSN